MLAWISSEDAFFSFRELLCEKESPADAGINLTEDCKLHRQEE